MRKKTGLFFVSVSEGDASGIRATFRIVRCIIRIPSYIRLSILGTAEITWFGFNHQANLKTTPAKAR